MTNYSCDYCGTVYGSKDSTLECFLRCAMAKEMGVEA